GLAQSSGERFREREAERQEVAAPFGVSRCEERIQGKAGRRVLPEAGQEPLLETENVSADLGDTDSQPVQPFQDGVEPVEGAWIERRPPETVAVLRVLDTARRRLREAAEAREPPRVHGPEATARGDMQETRPLAAHRVLVAASQV